ncbi:MAG: DUF362 domain-containing protein [Acidobacteria bacterium]|nr:DUF362 domain-containing protein [Acidobacteriota bacterium]
MKTADSLQPPSLRPPSRVAIRRVESYSADLTSVLSETLQEYRLPMKGKTVLLKPNFVAVDPEGRTNTHPALVAAAREAFLRLGAGQVMVGEGPALERDTEAILESMRFGEYLRPQSGAFVDLNTDDVHPVTLETRASSLKELNLPATALRADFLVSMPKLKTHHWAGVTLSLKNMFGVVPGNCYGWPKNLLHWAGITRAVLDLNSTLRPDFAIVDGIVGMEGNGPIEGTPKPCGVVVMGDDPVAVDATCVRIMDLLPERIEYLVRAGLLLGHLEEAKIQQIGETLEKVCTPFEVLETFKSLRRRGNRQWNAACS